MPSKEDVQVANKHMKNYFNFITHYKNANENHNANCKLKVYTFTRMVRITEAENTTNQQAHGENKTVLHCLWECWLVHLLWETAR